MAKLCGWGALAGATVPLVVAACSGGVVPSPPSRPPSAIVTVPLPMVQPLPRTAAAPRLLKTQIDRLVTAFPGKAGVAIRAVDEGWTVQSGGMLSLPQQSVSKLWVAMTVMWKRDQGLLKLDDPVTVTIADLTLFHQPIAVLVKGDGYHTTVSDLMLRALTMSDNTANDRLLKLVGGPQAVRAFIAEKRLGAIRFGPGERLLQSGTAGVTWNQSMALGRGFEAARAKLPMSVREAALARYIDNPPDGAAPLAIADALARLARGELLTETSTRILLDTMARSRTGRARLKAGTPAGWQLAHKTGTGQELGRHNAGFNDVGLLTSPDGRRYAVAVMIGDTFAPMRTRQQLIQNVAATLTGTRADSSATESADEG